MHEHEQVGHDQATVLTTGDGWVEVTFAPASSCSSCGMKGFCSGQHKNNNLKIPTSLKLQEGQVVTIKVAPRLRVLSSFLVFVMPILFMIAAYLVAAGALHLGQDTSIVASFAGLGVGGLIVWVLNKVWGNRFNFEIEE